MGLPPISVEFEFTDPPVANQPYHRTALYEVKKAAAMLEANKR